MVPTLFGRIQTRIFVLIVVGGLWTLLLTPVLPGVDDLGHGYQDTFIVLATVIVVGIGWEFLYHALQQFRWEKDWPTLFGLLLGIPEGALIWLLLQLGVVPTDPEPTLAAFLIQFCVVWVAQWATVNGPMRVPFIHWRFRGGRLV